MTNIVIDEFHHWNLYASCAYDVDPELFFPPRDKALYKKIATEAKSHCFGDETKAPCPVRFQCLWQAVSEDQQHGIWGGLSHRERNAMVRKWNKNYKDEMTLEEYVKQLVEQGKK
jgi:WhiB family redox-sensing transcriptional regulator